MTHEFEVVRFGGRDKFSPRERVPHEFGGKVHVVWLRKELDVHTMFLGYFYVVAGFGVHVGEELVFCFLNIKQDGAARLNMQSSL